MATRNEGIGLHQVACEVCLKEVPPSEAVVSEAEDYVAYFCGTDCYQKWRSRREPPEAAGAGQTPSGSSEGPAAR